MQPLRDLLNRIRWDPAFGAGTFALGYDDRVAHQESVVSLSSVAMDAGGFSFSLTDDDGNVVHIPLHRVRCVYRDSEVIWRRPTQEPPPGRPEE